MFLVQTGIVPARERTILLPQTALSASHLMCIDTKLKKAMQF